MTTGLPSWMMERMRGCWGGAERTRLWPRRRRLKKLGTYESDSEDDDDKW
ncbi:hypothetical protein SESBI_50886 [Sesbania bispinosa]|nr:hypothetical protein SESBI_50886 [Sesbania bispinosa]